MRKTRKHKRTAKKGVKQSQEKLFSGEKVNNQNHKGLKSTVSCSWYFNDTQIRFHRFIYICIFVFYEMFSVNEDWSNITRVTWTFILTLETSFHSNVFLLFVCNSVDCRTWTKQHANLWNGKVHERERKFRARQAVHLRRTGDTSCSDRCDARNEWQWSIKSPVRIDNHGSWTS